VPSSITPRELQEALRAESPLALIDVREQGEYNATHIPGSSSLPRRLLEFRFARLVPCPDVQVVLCDDDGQRGTLAARTLERFGYSHVSVLDGGINRWASEGLRTEWGMNVPSKAFGERVEAEYHVPSIEAVELHRRMENGDDVLVLDTRTPEEYADFCVPGGRSLPGGELAYRIDELLRKERDPLVVVNCAGRTRSIIGARILQRMGVRNVVSLKNGTAGWTLAGLDLERGADRLDYPEPSPQTRSDAEAFAVRLIQEDGVRRLSIDALQSLLVESSECMYLVDVRSRSEYVREHIPGFAWFPGGQAVQRSDDVVAIRSALVVFCCDRLVRGAVTASWFRQMGYPRVAVVDGGVRAWADRGLAVASGEGENEPFGLAEAEACAKRISPDDLHARMSAGASRPTVLFVDTSRQFAHGHVPGSIWLSRSWLELHVGRLVPDLTNPVIITDIDGGGAALAASSLAEIGYTDVSVLAGGIRAWRSDGLPLELGLSGVMQPPDDVVLSGPERSAAESIEYLRWETALGPHQLG